MNTLIILAGALSLISAGVALLIAGRHAVHFERCKGACKVKETGQ